MLVSQKAKLVPYVVTPKMAARAKVINSRKNRTISTVSEVDILNYYSKSKILRKTRTIK